MKASDLNSSKAHAKPTSLGDIAKMAGVSRMAVSYALRNNPKVSADTRRKILQIAETLNYAPDSRVAESIALARNTKFREPIPVAWLSNDADRNIWHTHKALSPFFEGAEKECRKLGYRMDEIWTREPGMTFQRVTQILFHRGIKGLIIAPSWRHGTERYRFDWRHFACVSFEKAVLAPGLNRITPDYFYNMMLTLKMLRRSGYRRIGVLLSVHFESRSHHAYCSALSYFYTQIPRAERLKPMIYLAERSDPANSQPASDWLAKWKPDAIICHHSGVPAWLNKLGYRVPDDIGVVHLGIDDDVMDWAGISQRKRLIGAETAKLLISQLQNHQFGLPEVPCDTLVKGYWQFGKTLIHPKPNSTRLRFAGRETRAAV